MAAGANCTVLDSRLIVLATLPGRSTAWQALEADYLQMTIMLRLV